MTLEECFLFHLGTVALTREHRHGRLTRLNENTTEAHSKLAAHVNVPVLYRSVLVPLHNRAVESCCVTNHLIEVDVARLIPIAPEDAAFAIARCRRARSTN